MIAAPAAGVAAAAILAGLAVASHATSPASIGAGIQAGPVYVTAAPGTTGRARVMVQDTGSATETLTILGGQQHGGQILPFPWVRTASVTTAPGIWRTVTFTIAVPAGTPPGQYRRYVGASAAAATPGALNAGATSFTVLVVTVAPSAPSAH